MSKHIDWNLCIICQEISSAELRCPTKCDRPPVDIYNALLENVEKFNELDALPVNVDYGEEGTVLAFVENNASCHEQCHQKFNNSKLESVKQRLQNRKRSSEEGNSTSTCRSKCKPSEVHRLCIFCSNLTSEELHEFYHL